MDPEGSVTHWLHRFKSGDHAAAQRLWERYFERLLRLARAKIGDFPRGMADEEDVVVSAFESFFSGIKHAHFPDLKDRQDLWCLLVVITARKSIDLIQRERRQRRGGPGTGGRPGELGPGPATTDYGLDAVIGHEPTPEFAALVADQCRRLLACLDDDELRTVAVLKMEGYTNAEIATQLGRVVATVERRLRLIRSIWQKEVE